MLGVLPAACSGLKPLPAGADFRISELVDLTGYGAVAALDDPGHVPAAGVGAAESEPLAVIRLAGVVRAYPLSVLAWHHVVNDVVGGVPVAISYSPLADAVAAWVARDGSRTLRFDASGKTFAGQSVLADRQTRSLWLPATGRAVAGPRAGRVLAAVPVLVVPAAGYLSALPAAAIADPGPEQPARTFGRSPYPGYADRTRPPAHLLARAMDARLPPMSLVAAAPGDPVYPFEHVRAAGVVNDGAVVAVWIGGVASAIDRPVVASSRDAGSVAVFVTDVGGRRLTFEPAARWRIRDRETGTIWTILGDAERGPLAGRRLEPLAAIRSLWFAWAAADPGARVYAP